MINKTFVEVLLEECDAVFFTYISDDKMYYSGVFTIRMRHYMFSFRKIIATRQMRVRIFNEEEELFLGDVFSFLNWWYDWRKEHD